MKTKGDDSVFHTNVIIGLTKREYFAAVAMQGLCSDPNFDGSIPDSAVVFADLLINSLNKRP